MTTPPNCAKCGGPSPREGHVGTLLTSEILDLRDHLACLDPSAMKFGFCDRGVELARSISAHSGEGAPRLRRKAKAWLREANRRFDIWHLVESAPVTHSSAPHQGAA